jgi:hypothetical protein
MTTIRVCSSTPSSSGRAETTLWDAWRDRRPGEATLWKRSAACVSTYLNATQLSGSN